MVWCFRSCRQKFNYIIRTLDDISELLRPIENVIRFHLIPAICDGRQCSDIERKILSFPIKMGGLGIINIEDEAKFQNETSRLATKVLVERIITQSNESIDPSQSKKMLKSLA
uniref:Uncharacterized protein n=1 Tax=Clytia hemisphaerica TaxID=252671 RepID=A0A7M6DQ38_9CNID